VITLALAVGVLGYVWERSHGKLSIDSVRLSAKNKSVGCEGTAHIVATIKTNGRGGRLTYEWLTEPQTPVKVLTATNGSGSKSTQVGFDWAFHGKGTGQAVAKLRVLTPETTEASIFVPYSCPS
jgi:hypothetical protein